MFNPPIKKDFSGSQNEQVLPNDSIKESGGKEEAKIADGITIHTMPEQYRRISHKAGEARTMGLFIVVGGLLLLVAISYFAYYFLFIEPTSNKNQIESLITASTTIPVAAKQEPVAIETELVAPQSASSTEIATTSGVLPKVEVITEIAASSSDIYAASSTELEIPIETSTPTLAKYVPVEDKDSDGLSNAEELIFGTDNDNIDSDGDGYSDLTEINNLYNPAGLGLLSGNSGIKKYSNKTYNYNLFYPTEWERQSVNEDNSIIFKSSDNQYIQVISQDNVNKLPIKEWYEAQFGVAEINLAQMITIKNNDKPIDAIMNEDGLAIYFCDKGNNQIYVISYSTGIGNVLSYKNILNIFVASFNFSSR